MEGPLRVSTKMRLNGESSLSVCESDVGGTVRAVQEGRLAVLRVRAAEEDERRTRRVSMPALSLAQGKVQLWLGACDQDHAATPTLALAAHDVSKTNHQW